MRRAWAILASLRTSAVLLTALAAVLLLGVLAPQRGVDPDGHGAALRSGPVAHLLLETLGFGDLATSPALAAVLAASFANLAAVLADRAGATLRRLRAAPPNEAQVSALLFSAGALELPGAVIGPGRVRAVLERMGYRVSGAAAGATWGVKHRLALLGFPLFHASFFLLLAGGVQLYLTRHVATVIVAEGVEVASNGGATVRRAPLGPPAPVRLALERVDVTLGQGLPLDLRAAVAIDGEPAVTSVNHPATRGPLTVLVERAGVAPVLWLTDAQGFTVDRVLAPAARSDGFPVRLSLGGGEVAVSIQPIPIGAGFPERAALSTAPVRLQVFEAGERAFEGAARPGERISVGARTLAVQEVRYWASFRLVHEHGGALLVAGFVLAVVGITWRMVFFRREVLVASGPGGTRVAGRGELFPARFREELEVIRDLLAAEGPAPGEDRVA